MRKKKEEKKKKKKKVKKKKEEKKKKKEKMKEEKKNKEKKMKEEKKKKKEKKIICLFIGCLTSQQHASECQGRICSDNFMCCHTEIEVAGQTFHLTQSQYTDTRPISPSTNPITPDAWQGRHWSGLF